MIWTWRTSWNAFVAPFSTLSPYAESPASKSWNPWQTRMSTTRVRELVWKLWEELPPVLTNIWELKRSQQREVVWFFTCRVLLSCNVLQYQGSTHFAELWSRHRIIGEFLTTWPSGSRKTIPFFIQVDLGMLLAEPQHSSFSFCFRIRLRGKKDLKILFTPPQKSVFSNRCWW